MKISRRAVFTGLPVVIGALAVTPETGSAGDGLEDVFSASADYPGHSNYSLALAHGWTVEVRVNGRLLPKCIYADRSKGEAISFAIDASGEPNGMLIHVSGNVTFKRVPL